MKEYKYKINGNTYKVGVGDLNDNVVEVEVNGVPYKVEMEKAAATKVVSAPRAAAAPRTATGEKVIAKASGNAGTESIKAPLPGVVLSIPVKVGDTVKASDTVLVLEAMKMENAIHAGRDGRVASINVNSGDSVLEGAVLLTLE
ncbi:MAG: acetyl-CoA carboxylase biotin carboxyl carrier protein subunit [Muribaculaceae bacterium]|jgi:biotin carboxyl carrier protein|nr:acetyl-CoA carboxylase biotin carboxyl carrier protein subunit [Muribaculaceae bacterium]